MPRHDVNSMTNNGDDNLNAVEFAVKNAWQESIRGAPFELNYGLVLRMPLKLRLLSRVAAALQAPRIGKRRSRRLTSIKWGQINAWQLLNCASNSLRRLPRELGKILRVPRPSRSCKQTSGGLKSHCLRLEQVSCLGRRISRLEILKLGNSCLFELALSSLSLKLVRLHINSSLQRA